MLFVFSYFFEEGVGGYWSGDKDDNKANGGDGEGWVVIAWEEKHPKEAEKENERCEDGYEVVPIATKKGKHGCSSCRLLVGRLRWVFHFECHCIR